jgi:ABC-type polysaccharide/polyol phosphate export permease
MINRAKHFLIDIYDKREILYELAKRDFQKKYMGSSIGFIWVYLEPLLFVSVLYVIFTFGLRAGNISDGTPFIVYFISGMIAWFYFSENLSSNAGIIKQHNFLLKKVDFRLSLLPIVKLMSSSAPHLFFILIALVIAAINGIYPTWYTLQLIYYFIAMVILLLGVGWLTSATNIFIPDVSKAVGITVTFGMWLTPLFWEIAIVPPKYQWIVKLNPFYYIVEGYRDSLIYGVGFWEKPLYTLYFWVVTIIMLWIGITVFGKLRPHFAEVA